MTTRIETKATADAPWLVTARQQRWTKETAAEVFRAHEAAGGSLASFARRHGLPLAKLHFWKQRLRRGSGALSFIPVEVVATAPRQGSPGGIEMDFHGLRLQVGEEVSGALLARVLRAAREALSC